MSTYPVFGWVRPKTTSILAPSVNCFQDTIFCYFVSKSCFIRNCINHAPTRLVDRKNDESSSATKGMEGKSLFISIIIRK